jgi:FkbM family methyltransferase
MSKLIKQINQIRNCRTIYDIGANEGKWTKIMSEQLNYNKNLNELTDFIMFDAFPDMKNKYAPKYFRFFNTPLYKEDNIELDFFVNDTSRHTTGNSFYQENTEGYENANSIKVNSKKLDTVITELQLEYPDVIKIDTQGAELDVLLGATEAIKHAKIIMCELSIYPYNRNGASFSEVNDFLIANNFLPTDIEEYHYTSNVLIQIDMIYVKRSVNQLHYPNTKNLVIR